jgi:hypothetical protein
MASGWVENLLRSQIVYTFRQFQMQRFITNLNPKGENHIGEAIVRENGELSSNRLFTGQNLTFTDKPHQKTVHFGAYVLALCSYFKKIYINRLDLPR